MAQYGTELSNLSYTNKDFGNIYPELLDLVKKISYKWDPSVSDESDPGVVLLKIAALMADKNNYNIDKNVLELFPLSVTQTANARQIFDQCGYSMRHYQGATTQVALTLVSEPDITEQSRDAMGIDADADLTTSDNMRRYRIPMFTMVCDSEKSAIYTLVETPHITSGGETAYVNAIQGVATEYSVNGETLITLAHLDPNNRLYFTETDIAENGIYINNIGEENWEDWIPVTNLVTQELGTKCYKFGVEVDGSRCYIEFPSDANYLLGEGIEITYVRTQGLYGNIRKRVLNQFYLNPTATRYIGTSVENSEDIEISATNVYITNHSAATNGRDIETIDEAYKNYQRIKTTFDTLVTLRDYSNYIITAGVASNGFVCDRTNDHESTYAVMYDGGVSSQTHTIIKSAAKEVIPYSNEELTLQHSVGDINNPIHYYIESPEMSAFDLRLYALEYRDSINTPDDYYSTFNLIDFSTATKQDQLNTVLEKVKCVNHDFLNFEEDRILMLRNKYPIKARIIPHYRLTDAQQSEVLSKVTNRLYQTLNSKEITFGEEAPYDGIYDTIMKADPRIKALVLDDITYETYAVYYHNDGTLTQPNRVFKEIRIDDNSIKPEGDAGELWESWRQDIFAKSVLAGVTPLFYKDGEFTYNAQYKTTNEYTGIDRLTTNSTMEMTRTSLGGSSYRHQYTVRNNENIVLTSPNLIVEQEYSTYVKYLHNISGGIGANADYSLGSDEFIMFFWKADEGDAFYQYVKYGEGSIISPTFPIIMQNDPPTYPSLPALPLNLLKGIPNGKGNTNEVPGVIDGSYTLTDYVTKLSGSGEGEYVLTGTNTIYVKKINKITLSDPAKGVNYPVYWVLNTSTIKDGREVYELFPEADATGTVVGAPVYSYTLQNGEYLMYTNPTKTQLLMLGAGTRIECQHIPTSCVCDVIDFSQLLAEGVDYLRDKWVNMGVATVLTATEMQFEQLGSGVTLRVDTQHPATELTINNTSIYSDVGSGVEFHTASATLSYGEGQSFTTLPSRNTSELEWKVKSVLNISCSPSIPQKLLGNQSISWVDETGTPTTVTIDGSDSAENAVFVVPDRSIDVVGGSNIDVTTVNVSGGDPLPLGVMVYTSNTTHTASAANSSLLYTEGNTIITINGDDAGGAKGYSDDICLPIGNYVFKLHALDSQPAVSTMDATFTIGTNKPSVATIVHMGGGAHTSYNTQGYYYYTLVVKQNATFKLELTALWSGGEDDRASNCKGTFTISPMIRYLTSIPFDNYQANPLNFVSEVIGELDVNGEFNYLYEIPDDTLIEYPLNSTSFLHGSHIYNRITICEWHPNGASNDIKVTNKIKEGSYSV